MSTLNQPSASSPFPSSTPIEAVVTHSSDSTAQKIPVSPPADATPPSNSPPNLFQPSLAPIFPVSSAETVVLPASNFQLEPPYEEASSGRDASTLVTHVNNAEPSISIESKTILPPAPAVITPLKVERKRDFLGGLLIFLALLASLGSVGLLAACLLDVMPPLPAWLTMLHK